MGPKITNEGEFDKGREHSRNATADRAYRPERPPLSTACAWILKASTAAAAGHDKLQNTSFCSSCTLNGTSRNAVRSEDDGLYQATIDGGGLACGDELIPAAECPCPVLAGKDDG